MTKLLPGANPKFLRIWLEAYSHYCRKILHSSYKTQLENAIWIAPMKMSKHCIHQHCVVKQIRRGRSTGPNKTRPRHSSNHHYAECTPGKNLLAQKFWPRKRTLSLMYSCLDRVDNQVFQRLHKNQNRSLDCRKLLLRCRLELLWHHSSVGHSHDHVKHRLQRHPSEIALKVLKLDRHDHSHHFNEHIKLCNKWLCFRVDSHSEKKNQKVAKMILTTGTFVGCIGQQDIGHDR